VKSKKDNKCHRCGDLSHFAKNCRAPKHLVVLYQKSLKEVKPAEDTRYEAHFSLAYEDVKEVGCSNQAPKEQMNNNSLNVLLDFGFGDSLEIWSNLGPALISHLIHML
jgi:hypothetical protein